MKTFAATALLALLPTVASAAWEEIEGGATTRPIETNSTIQAIMVSCVDGPVVEVYSDKDGPVLPVADPSATADYFYKAGAVEASVDDKTFPLATAGSDIAIVLFSEGPEAESHLAPLDPKFLSALRTGSTLRLSFDVTPAAGPDGSVYDTWARFSLEGAGPMIEKIVKSCS